MNIQLDQKEIELAIRSYIEEKGLDIADKTIEITLKAGRKGGGHSAAVTIVPKGAIVTTVQAPGPIEAVEETHAVPSTEDKTAEDEPLFG